MAVRIHSERETVHPALLKPYPHNPRVHSDAQVTFLMGLIRQYGFTNPILVDEEYRVLAGHGRLEAANRLGLTEVSVLILRGLTDIEKRSYIVADNRASDQSEWDYNALSDLCVGLSGDGVDLLTLGFGEEDLAQFGVTTLPSDSVESVERPVSGQTEPDAPTYLTFSVKISPEEKALVDSLISDIKRNQTINSTSEAFMALIRAYEQEFN